MSCKLSLTRMLSSVISALSITQYYQYRCWCRGAAHIPYLEGATRRCADQHRWNGAVQGIAECDGVGQGGTEKWQAPQSETEQDGEGQVDWSSIRSEWSTGGKERHISWLSGDRPHISGWVGVEWRQQSTEMGRGRFRMIYICRFRSVWLFGWRQNLFQGIVKKEWDYIYILIMHVVRV